MGGRKCLYLLGLISSFLLFFWAYQTKAASNILISQIQTSGGTGATNQDFIELYNQADQAFDLKGCKLVKRTASGSADTNIKSWSTSTLVSSRGYYLWANSNYTTISTSPDVVTSETISDNNTIALRCGSSEPLTIMDALTWGQVLNPLGEGESPNNPEPNQVLLRKNSNNTKLDSDNNKTDFEINSPNPHNTSFIENTNKATEQIKEVVNTIYIPTPIANINSGEIVINEMVSDPVTGDSEWIELYNKSSKSINLSDLTLEDASGGSMQLSGTLGNDQSNKFIVIKNLKFTLNNDSESIILKHQGLIIDRVTYNKTHPNNNAPVAVKPYSLSRIPDGQDTDQDNVDFKISLATPGQINIPTNANQIIEETTTPDLIINELFPNPFFDDQNEEFIELFNKGASKIDLTDWLIKDNLSIYKINSLDFPNTTIEPNNYFILPRPKTNIVLDNSSKEMVELMSPDKKVVYKTAYPIPAPEGQSYIRDNEGNFTWSLINTPNKNNILKQPNLPPKISLIAPEDGLINELLVFDASDSADPELSKLTYLWNFGDGSSSTLATPSHAYSQNKTYTIELIVSDSAGVASKKTSKIKILNKSESNEILTKVQSKTTKENNKIKTQTDKQYITGTVTIPTGLISKNTFYLDSVEYPIQISKPLDFIKTGQQISLTGTLKDYSNGPKFFVSKNDIVSNLGLGKTIEPQETDISSLNIEQDNTFVKISGQINKLNTKSLTIKEGEEELKIITANPINKNSLVKGLNIKAIGFLKYENSLPKLYVPDNSQITISKIVEKPEDKIISIPPAPTDYNYLYWVLGVSSSVILLTIFWNKIIKLKIISQIKKLLPFE